MNSEILSVAETAQAVYAMFIDYEEGDIASAIGHVYTVPGVRGNRAAPNQVLATNDTLRVMWASPSGAIWVASADGNVGTTAAVSWPAANPGVDYRSMGGSAVWSVTSLPRLKGSQLPPNITTLWGTSDKDVHAGTYGGHLLHWNGKDWRQLHEGTNDGSTTIAAFGGTSPKNVYAVGAQDTLLHFDGTAWRQIAVPGAGSNGNEGLTGVHPLPDEQLLIVASGDQGRLLHGNAAGLHEIGRYPMELIGVVSLGERVLFPTGEGVAELSGRDVKILRDNYPNTSMFPGVDRVFLLKPAQEQPNYVEYRPDAGEAPWWKFQY